MNQINPDSTGNSASPTSILDGAELVGRTDQV